MSVTTTAGEKQNRFVFVAPMFNASAYVGQMLASVCSQSYDNWRVVLIDDVSDQHEVLKQKEIIECWSHLVDPGDANPKIRVVWNDEKKWEVANVLHGISMCEDDDIVCRLDADDWLTEIDGLKILNALYNATGADALWTAHRWGFTDKNISGPMAPDADPYAHPWVSSHLKTFRKKLLNGVNDANYRGEAGEYIRRAGDQAIYLPVLHNAKNRGFVPRVMYHYTINDVPETYQTPDARFQRDEALFLRARGYVK
jgi:glycosyltransferase involved in cell wall biosynthesis